MANESAEELTALICEIQERVRARHPNGAGVEGGIRLADLMPLLEARDAAEGKVASIGMVNPRRPGPGNAVIQFFKRLVARGLDWHVREQVEFNRAIIACVQTTLEALNQQNRALHEIGARAIERASALEAEARELRDIRSHWAQWRQEWEAKLSHNEILFLRNMAESQAAFQHRAALLEEAYRDLARSQHADFEKALSLATLELQKRMWDDFLRMRADYDAVIHRELRTLRQRGAVPALGAMVSGEMPSAAPVDWLAFAERFRGSEEHVRAKQRIYAERFAGCQNVLDLGCGRGELLQVLCEAGIPARGVDANPECVAICTAKGRRAETADLFAFLAGTSEKFDGIVSTQVVEHLPPLRVPELVRLASERLKRGGLLAVETPNPECLAIFATHFWIDPTHTRPVPATLLSFWMEEAGLGAIEVLPLNPAAEAVPALQSLPGDVRAALFGGLDYAMFARKL